MKCDEVEKIKKEKKIDIALAILNWIIFG